jgi:hypothetical protein
MFSLSSRMVSSSVLVIVSAAHIYRLDEADIGPRIWNLISFERARKTNKAYW